MPVAQTVVCLPGKNKDKDVLLSFQNSYMKGNKMRYIGPGSVNSNNKKENTQLSTIK